MIYSRSLSILCAIIVVFELKFFETWILEQNGS